MISKVSTFSDLEAYLCGHLRWYHFRDHRQDHGDDPHPSSPDPYRQGFESDPDHVYHNHAHGDHPCEESSRLGHDEVGKGSDVEGSDHDGLVGPVDHGHGLSRNARKPKGEYGPTRYTVNYGSERRDTCEQHTSIFKISSRPRRLLCIS